MKVVGKEQKRKETEYNFEYECEYGGGIRDEIGT